VTSRRRLSPAKVRAFRIIDRKRPPIQIIRRGTRNFSLAIGRRAERESGRKLIGLVEWDIKSEEEEAPGHRKRRCCADAPELPPHSRVLSHQTIERTKNARSHHRSKAAERHPGSYVNIQELAETDGRENSVRCAYSSRLRIPAETEALEGLAEQESAKRPVEEKGGQRREAGRSRGRRPPKKSRPRAKGKKSLQAASSRPGGRLTPRECGIRIDPSWSPRDSRRKPKADSIPEAMTEPQSNPQQRIWRGELEFTRREIDHRHLP